MTMAETTNKLQTTVAGTPAGEEGPDDVDHNSGGLLREEI